ncbi:MAG: hypothetical protein ACRC3G_02035 [Bacteroidales bacterium]
MKKQLLILLALSLTTQLVLAQTLFRDYYDFTRKKVKEEYQADGYGNKNGTYKKYSEYGGVVVSGTYNSKSEKIGTWIERYTGGKIWRKYSYDKKGRRHGVEAEYFPSGEKRYEANWRHGKQHGRVLEWNAEVAGIFRLYDDEIVTLYKKRSDVDLHLIEEKYYKNGVIDSICRRWHDSLGELIKEGFYKNGKFNGVYRSYSSYGKLIQEDFYKNGELNGVCRRWHDYSGKLIQEGFYENGVELRGENFLGSYDGCNTRVSTIVGDTIKQYKKEYRYGKESGVTYEREEFRIRGWGDDKFSVLVSEKYYYNSGKLHSVKTCPTGKECVEIEYTEAGQVKKYKSPDLNIKGTCYANGNLKSTRYVTRELDETKEYFESGKLRRVDSCPTGKECVEIEYTEAGQVRKHKSPDLNIEGTCYENGNLRSTHYVTKELDETKEYFESGKLRSVKTCPTGKGCVKIEYTEAGRVKSHQSPDLNIKETYYANGKLKSTYRKTRELDETKEYFESGKLRRVKTCPTGKECVNMEYYENGELSKVTSFPKGSHTPVTMEYYENGKLKSHSSSDLNIKESYYVNGNLKSTSRKTDDLELTKEYYANGKLSYLDSCPIGKNCVSIAYTETGRVKRLQSPDLNIEETYYVNKNRSLRATYRETRDLKLTKEYYENGKLSKLDSCPTGKECVSIEYYENGKLKSHASSDLIIKETYYENGNLAFTYRETSELTLTKEYYVTGELLKVDSCPKGKKCIAISYKENGKVASKKKYANNVNYK